MPVDVEHYHSSMLTCIDGKCSRAISRDKTQRDMTNCGNSQIMYDILDSETLSKVCHERYYTSLKEFRAKVVSACNTEMDAVAFKRKNTIFPRMYNPFVLGYLCHETDSLVSNVYGRSSAAFI